MRTRVVPASELSSKDLRAKKYMPTKESEEAAAAHEAIKKVTGAAAASLLSTNIINSLLHSAQSGKKTEAKIARLILRRALVLTDVAEARAAFLSKMSGVL